MGHAFSRRRRTGIVSKSIEALANAMSVIVLVFKAARLQVSGGLNNINHTAVKTGPSIPGSTVRHRSSRTEV